ncbi:DUF1156 domain-containing protein [Neoaquamicrobium sediminum]|uniref:DUF1156 domain-containing protein n=1 Tax=Neoaquamicrobium sediminum TaxID=1849104 RepID=UPI001FD30323|nr:hypothetical protein [Mesorhizobium sediminum]
MKYYGEWMREKAWERIGHLYPQVDLPKEYGGGKATVIAWIWARTVPSPDPAFADVQVPIASNFVLNAKAGKEVWVEPIVDRQTKTIVYRIRHGGTKAEIAKAREGTKAGRGANFRCLMSDTAVTPKHITSSGKNGSLGQTLLAIVAEGNRGRFYLPATKSDEELAFSANPVWKPEQRQPENPRWFSPPAYGLETFADLFSARQILLLNTLIDLLGEVRALAKIDAVSSIGGDLTSLEDGGHGPASYADAITVYLSFAISRVAMSGNAFVRWNPVGEKAQHIFGRQAIPMLWDYAETNPLGNATGAFNAAYKMVMNGLDTLPCGDGKLVQADAQTVRFPDGCVLNTDPPYYDNIGYADLSDFFFCWLRPMLRDAFPNLFSLLATPKSEELIATPYRHGGRDQAETHFMEGMKKAIRNFQQQSSETFPAAIYYAFKQSEVEQDGISSTGWATFLEAVVASGFSIVGTWPVRTEMRTRQVAMGTNALANSVVLVCRKKEASAEVITRAEFIRALKRELPPAIAELQAANIAPADMPQSAIGPGMGVFSRYTAVLEADDSPMTVKTALQLINAELDEYLGGIQGEFDADTRFAITWFEQNGMGKGDYGVADNLARARGISVDSVKHAGVIESAAGKVRLLKRDELDVEWTPQADGHLTVWECLQQLVRLHENDGVAHSSALMLKKIGDKAEAVKDLAYCLYDISANKRKDAKEATAYNALIADWTDLTREAAGITDMVENRQTRMNF